MEMTIGANIKRLRTAKNITQEQLSVAMNVTCAAVSKWERGETYPDITLLQPLSYFFEVTLDELMGYDQKKVQADIDETIALYRKHWKDSKGREIIVKAYHDYPNDYRKSPLILFESRGCMALFICFVRKRCARQPQGDSESRGKGFALGYGVHFKRGIAIFFELFFLILRQAFKQLCFVAGLQVLQLFVVRIVVDQCVLWVYFAVP